MASKWEKMKGKLPDAPASDMTSFNADSSFAQKVDDAKAALSELPLPTLMGQLVECNQEWDELEARKKELNVQFEALGQLIKQHFVQQGVANVRSEGGKLFYQHIEPIVSVKKGRKDEAETWVGADPARDYLWSIHPQTLASWVKDKLENPPQEGEEVEEIPEFFDVMLKTSIRVK